MKSLWNSFKIAFSMFSKIPMPQAEWSKENMKYMFCFFPFIGTAIGAVIMAVACLADRTGINPVFVYVILTVIPVLITGGIHVDGLLDTADALSSWQERKRRLEILKDSNAGAFAVITACVYFLLWVGAWSEICFHGETIGSCALDLWFPDVFQVLESSSSKSQGRRNRGRVFQKIRGYSSEKYSGDLSCASLRFDDLESTL